MTADSVRAKRGSVGRWAGLLGVSVLVVSMGTPPAAASGAFGAAEAPSSWTVYHGDNVGSGVSQSVTSVSTSSPAWRSPVLDGQLYGEPLVASGMVYVATENDTVYALSSSTGAVVWSTHIATAVPSAELPCGDISPKVGITGTPVIDPSRNAIFVVADEQLNGAPAHVLVRLNATSGAIELHQDVDPPGADPAALLQRTGLALDAGQVVFAMGGNYGDCATYRGRVGALSETGGTVNYFTVDAATGDSQGAIWMGGAAPVVDSAGHIWVAVGNGSVYSASDAYDDSDSALELSASLQLLQYFAPASWPQNNSEDLDMSMAPAVLSDGQVVLAGKSRIVYLLDGSHLGGIGGQETSLASGCGDDIDGGTAVVGTTVYLPCVTGPIALQVNASPPALEVKWRSAVGGGPPIVAAGLVWTVGLNGVLYGLDPSSGAVRQQVSIGTAANHFPTASVGAGLLLAPASDRVVAFRAATTAPGSTATTPSVAPTTNQSPGATTAPTTSTPSSATGSGAHPKRSSHGVGAATVAGSVAGAVVVVAVLIGLVWRRRWRSLRRPRQQP